MKRTPYTVVFGRNSEIEVTLETIDRMRMVVNDVTPVTQQLVAYDLEARELFSVSDSVDGFPTNTALREAWRKAIERRDEEAIIPPPPIPPPPPPPPEPKTASKKRR